MIAMLPLEHRPPERLETPAILKKYRIERDPDSRLPEGGCLLSMTEKPTSTLTEALNATDLGLRAKR